MADGETVWWAVTIDSTASRELAAFWAALFDAPVIEPGADREGWFRIQPRAPTGRS